MKRLLIFLVFLPLISCNTVEQQETKDWQTLTIGRYSFEFPADFKLIEEVEVDSYVGRVEGDSISFFFDYGEYSNDLALTPEQYLEDSTWVRNASYQFMENGKTYNVDKLPKVEVLSMRKANFQDSLQWKGSDYVARGRHEKYVFDFPIYLPEETKEHDISIDTIGNQYRKIVKAKNPKKGITGIYIKPLNSDKALSMVADSLTKTQQDLVAKILSTVSVK
ncbi:hypothetical protein I2I11_13695 [Pontibacter sp. 172403-2]|uniref:hypothetical protein n=1 Tax=Pontibacter rufus TaxID=2791028 RepID=UPI0018AFE8DF|nr:hypothetical protein [Pontibacter sp. 172403-2]MBF9254354.1 hypothetical protein [Pontibacter sp. 172403-2]